MNQPVVFFLGLTLFSLTQGSLHLLPPSLPVRQALMSTLTLCSAISRPPTAQTRLVREMLTQLLWLTHCFSLHMMLHIHLTAESQCVLVAQSLYGVDLWTMLQLAVWFFIRKGITMWLSTWSLLCHVLNTACLELAFQTRILLHYTD